MRKLTPSQTGSVVVPLDEARRNIEQYREEHRAEAAERQRAIRAEQEQAVIEKRLGQAGVPERFRSRTFDTFMAETDRQNRVLRACRLYADKFDRVLSKGSCMLLLGGVGTGKTHLAAAILQSVLAQGYTGAYYRVADALRLMRSVYSRDDMTEQDVLATLADCDLLVLDEVGVAIGDPEKRKAMLYDVLDTRYAAGKPSLLMSNLDAKGMEEYIGTRLYDRLMEDGGAVLEFNWGSYRRGQ